MSYRADKLGDGRTDGRTDVGNDNTRRPKLALGKKAFENDVYKMVAILLSKKANCNSIVLHWKQASYDSYGGDICCHLLVTPIFITEPKR